MTQSTPFYTAPDFGIRREILVPTITGVASTSVSKYHLFQAAKIKAVHGTVLTAGTNTVAGFDILVGTASVGEITFGSNTAGYQATSGAINAVVPQNGLIDIKGKADSATLVAALSIEYEVTPNAEETD